MAENLEQQEKIRRRLNTDVAHELRTPVVNVSSYLEAIMEGVWEPTTERLKSCARLKMKTARRENICRE